MKRRSFQAKIESNLRGKWPIALVALPIGLGFGSFVPTWFFAHALAYALGIPMNAPVRDQPNGWLWCLLFFIEMEVLLVAGFLLGMVLNALILRLGLGWPWTRVRGAGVCPEWIVYWLERQTAVSASAASKAVERLEDPMFDPQLDHVRPIDRPAGSPESGGRPHARRLPERGHHRTP
jgi:hypothetical protein